MKDVKHHAEQMANAGHDDHDANFWTDEDRRAEEDARREAEDAEYRRAEEEERQKREQANLAWVRGLSYSRELFSE